MRSERRPALAASGGVDIARGQPVAQGSEISVWKVLADELRNDAATLENRFRVDAEPISLAISASVGKVKVECCKGGIEALVRQELRTS